jgi:hypothetical protein
LYLPGVGEWLVGFGRFVNITAWSGWEREGRRNEGERLYIFPASVLMTSSVIQVVSKWLLVVMVVSAWLYPMSGVHSGAIWGKPYR